MSQTINKKADFILYYQCALAVGAVFAFFTNLDSYLFDSGITPSPVNLIILFGIASTPLLASFPSRIKYLPLLVFVWGGGFVSLSLISCLLSLSSEAAYQELRTRILSVVFILLMLLIFSRYQIVITWARRAIIITGLMAVINNIYEFFNPLVFNAMNDSGRPAGFYVNPNRAGCALVLALIAGVSILPQRYRVPFVSIISLGVLLSFSRGAMLGWCVVVMIFTMTQVISVKKLVIYIVITGVIIINLTQLQDSSLINDNMLGRFEWLQNPTQAKEDSAESRAELAKIGWQMFVQHPILGNGIGSTQELSVGVSTHNMYLYLMADHGFLGALILPILVYAVTRRSRGETKYIAFAFAAFILLWGLFSHNILDERYILLTFALIGAMSVNSQLEQSYQLGHKL